MYAMGLVRSLGRCRSGVPVTSSRSPTSSLLEKCVDAVRTVEFSLPGAGGLRGSLYLAPAQAMEIVEVCLKALMEVNGDALAHDVDVRTGVSHYGISPSQINFVFQAAIQSILGKDK